MNLNSKIKIVFKNPKKLNFWVLKWMLHYLFLNIWMWMWNWMWNSYSHSIFNKKQLPVTVYLNWISCKSDYGNPFFYIVGFFIFKITKNLHQLAWKKFACFYFILFSNPTYSYREIYNLIESEKKNLFRLFV